MKIQKACTNCVSFSHTVADCPYPGAAAWLGVSPRVRLLSDRDEPVGRLLAGLHELPARPQGQRRIAEEAGRG